MNQDFSQANAALINELEKYIPYNEQEEKDKELILRALCQNGQIWTRDNTAAHLTVSGWVVNADRSKVLMAYHNIYQSWSWLGGHADGNTDLLAVAVKEVQEESGIQNVKIVSPSIYSVEVLTVDGHEKKGMYVSSHLHLNITYLLEADDSEIVHSKADENSAVGWFTPQEAIEASNEPWFRMRIYKKLADKLIKKLCV